MNTIAELNDSLIGRYLVEKEIGQGGMATVYVARDVRHDRRVAIKVLHPELAAVLGPERFITEMKVTANLQHPHILPLFDSGTARSQLFYVMPFVEGESLRDRLAREQQLPIDEAIRVTREVASALDYAHRHNVVHRDIKPENILLHDGTALVADFGIALAVSNAGGSRLTQTGLSLGTPQYMSPEQATGDRNIDGRTDVYSLGCMLYEMLTGEPPFTGTSAQAIVARVLTESVRPMRARRDTISPSLEAVVLKAVQKLPADRFATAAEFAAALTAAPTTTANVYAPAVARRRIDWRVALLGGLMLGAAAAYLFARNGGSTGTATAGQRQQLTFNGRAHRPAISPDGKWIAYVDEMCQHGSFDLCRSVLLVQEVGSTRAVPVIQNAPRLGSPRWTHDGTQLVIGGEVDSVRAGVFVIPRTGGAARLIGPRGAFDTHPSADSIVVIRSDRDRPQIALYISIATGTIVDSSAQPIGPVRDINWAPDGRHVAATTPDRVVRIHARDGSESGRALLSTRASIRWNLAGTAVLAFRVGAVKEDELVSIPVGGDGRITGAPTVIVPRVPTLYQGEFDIARRSGRIAFATGDAITDLWTFDASTPEAPGRQRTRGTTWYGDPAISPDGTTLYYGRGDALGDNVYALTLKDDSEEPLTAQDLPFGNSVRIAADGKRIAFGHPTADGYRLDVLALPSRQPSSQAGSRMAALNIWPIGDRGYLLGGAAGNSLELLDSIGGTWRHVTAPDSLLIRTYAPSPDGLRAVVLASTRNGSLLGITSLTSWQFRPIPGQAQPSAPVTTLNWEDDDNIYFTTWRRTDERPTLWRIAATGGTALRVAAVPVMCDPLSVSYSARARLGACITGDFRSDIWILDGIGTR